MRELTICYSRKNLFGAWEMAEDKKHRPDYDDFKKAMDYIKRQEPIKALECSVKFENVVIFFSCLNEAEAGVYTVRRYDPEHVFSYNESKMDRRNTLKVFPKDGDQLTA